MFNLDQVTTGHNIPPIPQGTVTAGTLHVRGVTKATKSGNPMIKIELKVSVSPYQQRRVFDHIVTMVGDRPNPVALKQIKAIVDQAAIETRSFGTTEQVAEAINGTTVVFKVKVDETPGHRPKNAVLAFLDPTNPRDQPELQAIAQQMREQNAHAEVHDIKEDATVREPGGADRPTKASGMPYGPDDLDEQIPFDHAGTGDGATVSATHRDTRAKPQQPDAHDTLRDVVDASAYEFFSS